MQKAVLFYSPYCEFSKEIIALLQKSNALSDFMIINASNGKYKIPNIIKCVPSIFVNNKVYTDDNLEIFIREHINSYKSQDIEPFFSNEMNSGIGYSYSYIGDDDADNKNIKNSLMYIDSFEENKIITPDESDFISSSDKVNMNKFQEDRESDIKNYLGPSMQRT